MSWTQHFVQQSESSESGYHFYHALSLQGTFKKNIWFTTNMQIMTRAALSVNVSLMD